VRNYAKSIKLFCEMSDIPIPWKKITRGLPRGKKYADDRIPTLEEIRKLVEYPDRRIKAIVYTMASFIWHTGRSVRVLAMGAHKTHRKEWLRCCRQDDCLCW
jgi:hypothetical protein